MKKIFTLLTLLMMITVSQVFAQTIYTVSSNSNYSANCTNCTFNIAPGVTLSISQAGTCNNCTFNGGKIDVKNSITCQPCTFIGNSITMNTKSINPNSGSLTSFDNVILTANGNSSILANTPVSISNSTFTFNGNSFFNNNSGQLDISNSTLNFFGNSYFIANAGPVNLRNASKLVAGDGQLSSLAYIKMNGPALNIYDKASTVVMANYNNYYFNWNSFNSLSNNKNYTTTYPSAASTMNCGANGTNACTMWGAPIVYGPAGLSSTGVAGLTALLPVVLTNFTANYSKGIVLLEWTTQQETNAAYFAIERSLNGSAWQKTGTVAAKGNTTISTRYTFTDAAAVTGIVYYRLVSVDLDAKKTYSPTQIVNASLVKEISFYPNPAVEKINVVLPGNTESTIRLMNQSGQVLQERKIAASTTMVSLPVQQYPGGMYILKVIAADGATQTNKVMIAH